MNKKIAGLFLLLALVFVPGSIILLKNPHNSTDMGSITPKKNTNSTASETSSSGFIIEQFQKQDPYTLGSLSESDAPANTSTTSHNVNPLLFSLPKRDRSFSKRNGPEESTEKLPEFNTLRNLFAIEAEPESIFNSPLGGKILMDEEDEISGLEINFTLKKNL